MCWFFLFISNLLISIGVLDWCICTLFKFWFFFPWFVILGSKVFLSWNRNEVTYFINTLMNSQPHMVFFWVNWIFTRTDCECSQQCTSLVWNYFNHIYDVSNSYDVWKHIIWCLWCSVLSIFIIGSIFNLFFYSVTIYLVVLRFADAAIDTGIHATYSMKLNLALPACEFLVSCVVSIWLCYLTILKCCSHWRNFQKFPISFSSLNYLFHMYEKCTT